MSSNEEGIWSGGRGRPSILQRRRKQELTDVGFENVFKRVVKKPEKVGSSSVTSGQPNFLDHCIFCLRKTKLSGVSYFNSEKGCPDLNETLQVVPSAEVPASRTLLDTLNRIWSTLQRNNLNEKEEEDLTFLETRKHDVFTSLPKMCRFCAHKFEAVDKLLRELQEQMKALREVIQGSKYGGKYSWRVSAFETELKNSNLEEASIHATLFVLGDLGKKSVTPTSTDALEALDAFSKITVMTIPPVTISQREESSFGLPPNEGDNCSEAIKSEDEMLGSEMGDENELEMPCEVLLGTDNSGDIRDPLPPTENFQVAVPSSSKSTKVFQTTNLKCDEEMAEESDDEMEEDVEYVSNSDDSSDQDSMSEEIRNFPTVNAQTEATNRRSRKQRFAERQDTTFPEEETIKKQEPRRHQPGGKLSKKSNQVASSGSQKKPSTSSYACCYCNETFRLKKALVNHKKEAHVRKIDMRKCDLCQDNVPLANIKDHLQAHVGEEYLLKCPNLQCSNVFSQYANLFYHITHSIPCKQFVSNDIRFSKLTYICDTCGFTCPTARYLRAHLMEEHENPTKNFSCPVDGCKQKFTQRQSVTLHLPHHDFHCNPKHQQCTKCSENLKVEEMEGHLKTGHQVQDIIKCSRCPFLFSSREELIDHLFIHRFSVLSCDMCSDDKMKFTRHKDLCEHYFNQHKIGVQFSCEYCDAVVFKLSSLKNHVNSYHNGEQSDKQKFVCTECGVSYVTRIAFQDHKIEAHGAKPYSCAFCSETFTRKDRLNRHVKGHKGAPQYREFKCEETGCGKVFKSGSGLRNHHSVNHGNQNEHICETCGKGFSLKSYLKCHKDFVHLGLRPHVCNICGEGFGTSHVLKRHRLIHTGERPFECEICGQSFRHKEVLRRHVEGHEKKGTDFKPNGPMKQTRKRVERKNSDD